MVFFPDQHLDDDTQIVFAERFGELTESHPVEAQVAERKEIHSIESGKDRTDFWHTDITFMNRPALAIHAPLGGRARSRRGHHVG